jgi:alkane 1-monooxygenase
MNDLKYLFAYTVPVAAYIAFESTGISCYAAAFYAFIVLPVLDIVTGETQTNISKEAVLSKKNKRVFDWMLYLNLPIVFGLLFLVFTKIQATEYALYELIGMGLSAGILLATNGINVAHELGHRKPYFERFMSKLLYMPCLYMHFYIEHNFGHHLHVGTPEDGATAKYNQNVYSFWWSSVTKQYFGAWKRQLDLLKAQKKSFLSLKNDVFWYHFIQAGYLFSVYFLFSPKVLVFAVAVGILSFLFLETINYIEHYGLRRSKLPSGRYERVQPHHSWNSNFNIGRIVLYELTRHSDHHFKASKKYQVLDSHEKSPTLPMGYPASILLSLLPPLWFYVINPLVPEKMK